MSEQCGDNRFEIINETKQYIIEATNIETSSDEMKVLDNICFRLWQLGLTKRNKDRLRELEKTPTLEEVKKEWEELGYEWRIPKEYPHMIWLVNDDEQEKWVLRIKINTKSKTYWKLWGDGGFDKFTFQEHQLLTKTFKALGWE